MSWEWKATVVSDWLAQGHRLFMHRAGAEPGTREVITGFTSRGLPTTEVQAPNHVAGFPGFLLPDDLTDAVRDAIEPGPSVAETRRLEEALTIERGRVNEALSLLWRVAPSPELTEQIKARGRDELVADIRRQWEEIPRPDGIVLHLTMRQAEFVRSVMLAFSGPESGERIAEEVAQIISRTFRGETGEA